MIQMLYVDTMVLLVIVYQLLNHVNYILIKKIANTKNVQILQIIFVSGEMIKAASVMKSMIVVGTQKSNAN